MFSARVNLVREKVFQVSPSSADPRQAATLTDDHTLFLLNQERERQAKVRRRPWIARALRFRK